MNTNMEKMNRLKKTLREVFSKLELFRSIKKKP